MSIPFQFKKFANYGSSHPAAARLLLQMGDLLGVSGVDETMRTKIKEYLFRCSDEMARAQHKRDAFLEKCKAFRGDVRVGRGIVMQQHAVQLREPEELSDDYQLFLIHLVIALRMALKAAGLILLGRPAGWQGIKQTVEARFPDGHPLRELLRRHTSWSDALFEARGEIEHDPFVFEGFKVQPSLTGVLQVVDPRMPDGSSAMDAIPRYYDDGFVFAEELVARAIESTFSHGLFLREIPEGQRDPAKPVRFVVTMPPGFFPTQP